jgi:signal transduction histidine kinase
MREVRIEELFTRVYTLLRPSTAKKGIKFNILLLQEKLRIMADPELLEQVLINLILNAVDAVEGRQNAAIDMIAGINPSGQPLIQVKDNGAGIDEEVLQNIFVPFFTTKKKGSGIGLSLSKQIMLLHKGNITVQSVKGEGTTFRLTFN